MENLVLGYTKTIVGTVQVISDNAKSIIEKYIDDAVGFLATNDIKANGKCGSQNSKIQCCDYSYNGNNLFNRKRNMNAVIYFCGVENFKEKIEVTFHRNGKISFSKTSN